MKIKLLIICIAFTLSCSINSSIVNSAANTNQNTSNSGSPTKETAKNNSGNVAKNVQAKVTGDSCPPVKRAGKRQIKAQTFPINFVPFADMCFVTFASVEDMMDEKDVPRGSTFHIYQNGNSVLDLPDAFDGLTACWVEAVSFKDLNADGLTDIIVAGSCLGAKDSYPANAVYANTGQTLTTKAEANQKLENFKKLSEIESFVKKNQNLFF